ncbi:MAG: hypothetical protein ACKOWF_03935 [Chloroflexota bacterium]
MNVLLFIIDQQRAIQHFPKGWENEHLPGMTRLKRHGLSGNFRGSWRSSSGRRCSRLREHPGQSVGLAREKP